ncbi:hypothetical protein GCM10027590_08810 [Nocardiopsis nanhaiensis]
MPALSGVSADNASDRFSSRPFSSGPFPSRSVPSTAVPSPFAAVPSLSGLSIECPVSVICATEDYWASPSRQRPG